MAKEIVPWADWVKRTGKLTIAIDESIGKQGWAKAFKDGIAKFNELSTQTWKLGVVFEEEPNQIKANVVAQAKVGDFSFGYKDAYYTMEEKPHKFDGKSVHGLCSRLFAMEKNRATKVREERLVKAFIFVPAKPHIQGPNSRLVGEPVRLVVAVHEMIHACGPGDEHHTADDVFGWPSARFDNNNPNDDRVEVATGEYKDVVIAGQTQSRPAKVLMPPIFLNAPTQDKIRKLWKV